MIYDGLATAEWVSVQLDKTSPLETLEKRHWCSLTSVTLNMEKYSLWNENFVALCKLLIKINVQKKLLVVGFGHSEFSDGLNPPL